jgi:hypothetical protein
MAKFMVLYLSPVPARYQLANTTPEQMKAGMGAWMQWADKAGDAIVDLGSPLAAATRAGSGPAPAGEITGYSGGPAGRTRRRGISRCSTRPSGGAGRRTGATRTGSAS